MVGNIGIGIANAIGFRRKNLGGGHISYPGLIAAWSAKGKTNDDEDRAVLKDLTGNGHDITLNGFAFSEMSGYGGYAYTAFLYPWLVGDRSFIGVNRNINYFTLTFSKIINSAFIWQSNFLFNGNALKLKVSGVSENVAIYVSYGSNRQNLINGENIILFDDLDNTLLYFATSTLFENANVRVELLPEYPDALVFDGVDDYGVNENMPILEDFTLIVKKNDIVNPKEGESFYISKSANVGVGAFILGFTNSNSKNTYCNLYGNPNYYNYKNVPILYVTPNLFNGDVCFKGGNPDTKILTIGSIRPGDSRMWIGAFYSAYLFNRSLDKQEIKSFIRKHIDPEYLLPSEIPTPDVYYDFTNGDNASETRKTVTDLSGNGNDATAHNFEWNEEGSGYKDGALYFDGVDDYVSLDAFDSGFKTVFIKCKWGTGSRFIYDQRDNTKDFENAINTSGSHAYDGRNASGSTYINGMLNTLLTSGQLSTKRHLITSILPLGDKTSIPYIGSSNTQSFNLDITLYKFLGFKEELTEEQINAIIKKYNLLDGVDEIEVS